MLKYWKKWSSTWVDNWIVDFTIIYMLILQELTEKNVPEKVSFHIFKHVCFHDPIFDIYVKTYFPYTVKHPISELPILDQRSREPWYQPSFEILRRLSCNNVKHVTCNYRTSKFSDLWPNLNGFKSWRRSTAPIIKLLLSLMCLNNPL